MKINITDIQRGNQVALWDIADRLDRRYTQHVRQLAGELGIPTGRKTKRDLIDEIAAMLATGNYPQVVINWNLH